MTCSVLAALAGVRPAARPGGGVAARRLAVAAAAGARAPRRAASAAASSGRERRCEGSREQREVASSFNAMTERLGRALESQRAFVGQRLAPAAHAADRPAAAARGRGAAGPATRASARTWRPPRRRPSASPTCCATCSSSRARRAPRRPTRRRRSPTWPPRRASAGSGAGRGGRRRAAARGRARRGRGRLGEDLAVILDNLIENALRYSPPGTPVGVELVTPTARTSCWSRARPRPGRAPRGARVRVRALLPRRGRPRRGRHRPRAADRGRPGAALGRRRRAWPSARAAARAPRCGLPLAAQPAPELETAER